MNNKYFGKNKTTRADMDLWHNGDSRAFQTAIVNGPGCFAKTNSGATAVVLTAREPTFALEVEYYKLKRCSNKECCKQCRYVMFKGTMTKWPVQKIAQGTAQKLLQHHDATDI